MCIWNKLIGVTPYLGSLSLVETLKRPKRILVVDVPIERDDGTIAHFEGIVYSTIRPVAEARVVCASTKDVTLSEVMALRRMTIKIAVNVPTVVLRRYPC